MDSINNTVTGGKAILKWKEIPEATGRYEIRYRLLGKYNNYYHHSSDDVDVDRGRGWRLGGGVYPSGWQMGNVTLRPASGGVEGATITGLQPREIYAVQIYYDSGTGATEHWVYAARDVYVWPFSGRPGIDSAFPNQGRRVATYPVYGHFPDRQFTYKICTDTFPERVNDWRNLINKAFGVWQEAVGDNITVAYDPSDCDAHWDVDFSILETIGVIADPLGLIRMRILREKIDEIQESDHQVSEVLMIDPPKDVEMLTGIYKFCVLGAAACAVSPQYAGDNDGRTVIQSADVLINWDRISRVPDTPNTASIQFNACPSGKNSAYRTLLHEAGHALGLSDAAVPENAKQIFNDFRSKIHQFIKRFFDATVLGILNRIIENTVGELPERTYETSHPSIADSVMNYDYEVQQNLDNNGAWVRNEPDCWPHPFDIMAINSIYQADYP